MIISIPFRSNAHELYAADHADWKTIRSYEMTEVGDRTAGYKTFVKFCYNTTGIASLVFAEDSVLTVKPRNDFDNLYEDDVVEWFFWTDQRYPVYFEFELSPHNKELPLFVSNTNGEFMGWLPWKYEGERRILHTVKVVDGVSWTASCFIPFALFNGLSNAKPLTGTVWRGNVFRMDFDELPEAKWALDPQTGKEFHNYRDFGAFRFE